MDFSSFSNGKLFPFYPAPIFFKNENLFAFVKNREIEMSSMATGDFQ
jgi:hypothetical protein